MSSKDKKEGRRRRRLAAQDIAGVNLVMLIYFCSGVCSLIDQVVWVRLLKLTLGNTVYASSIVVSVFMGGLALGALIMGRYADRIRRRLRLYAVLELCAAISALSLPWALRLVDGAYRWFFLKYHPSPTGLMFVQVVVSAAILLVPTIVMGSTLPLLGRYVTALKERVGRRVGRLYALNTLGAALGCFLAGFVLIRMVGVMGTLYIAAGINMLVAFGGWMLSRFYDVTGEPAAKAAPAEQRSPAREKTEWGRRHILMLAVFFSGLISIGYELIWMRSVVVLLGGFTYVFSAVLTIYLLGNVIGAWIGSRLSKRLKHPAAAFGVTLTCLGITGIFYLPWLSMWFLKVLPSIIASLFGGLLEVRGFSAMVLPLLNGAFLFLLPALIMGIGFPLALQAWSNYQHKVGQTTGTVYGVNTIGAVLGGVIAGFLLIPLMGVQLSITVLGLVGIWLGWMMLQMFAAGAGIKRRMVYSAIPVTLTIVAVLIPSDLFERKIVPSVRSFSEYETVAVEDVQEGVTTTVAVRRTIDGKLLLSSDGVDIAGDDLHRVAQKILGHLGLLLREDAGEILSIGFGGGETTACMAKHNLNRIDCVEIAPEVVRAALKFFKHINLGDQLNQRVNMMYMDGKNYLYLTGRHYDIIVNGADIPAHSGSAPMFAREHFQNAKEHLNPGGLFITKLHLASISESGFNSILGTFLQVYPHVTIWFPMTKPIAFFYLVGSRQEQVFSLKHIKGELEKENVRNSVDYLNFHNSLDVLSCYIGDENDIKKYLKKFHINSDYTPYVEFDIDKRGTAIMQALFRKFIETVRGDSLARHIDWAGISENEQEKWVREYELLYKVSTCVLKTFGGQGISSQLQDIYDGLSLMPEHTALIDLENRCLFSAKRMLTSKASGADRAVADMDILLQGRPNCGQAWLIKSWALQQKKEMSKALTAAQRAVQYAPHQAEVWNNLGRIFLKFGQVDKAISYFKGAVRLRPNEATLHHDLGVALLKKGLFDEADSQFRQVVRIRPNSAEAHLVLGNFLAQCGKKDEAAREYRESLRLHPNYIKARKNLDALIGSMNKQPASHR